MGILSDSLFSALMSWVRALVSAIWALFSSERTTALEFLAKNWIGIAALIIVLGLVMDWLIWLIRWQPYHIWASRVRRLLRIAPPEYEAEEYEESVSDEEAALAAYEAFDEAYMPPQGKEEAGKEADDQEQWMPLPSPVIGEDEAQRVMKAAEQVPDNTLGQYPGMRYDSDAAGKESFGSTRRFGTVHAEGPGAMEVTRRRAEIEAWQQQLQDEAREKALVERRAREEQAERARAQREAQEAHAAEQERFAREAQEAYEAEQARLAREAQETYEAEQQRLAQEAYERELEEYERQRAKYERELAEYNRQMEAYEAALAAQQEPAEQNEDVTVEFAQENPQPVSASRRRRRAASYSDMVEGDAPSELPDVPQWTQIKADTTTRIQPAASARTQNKTKQSGHGLLRSSVEKMAQMMEADSEDVTGITALPPRVDRQAAYKPAKKP